MSLFVAGKTAVLRYMYVLLLHYLQMTLEVDGTETKPQRQQPLQKVISKDR